MQQVITAQVQIHPGDYAQLCDDSMYAYMQSCNEVSSFIFKNKTLHFASISNKIYKDLREKYGLNAQETQSSIRTVIASYKTIHATEKKWSIQPQYSQPQLKLLFNRDYSFKSDGTISLSLKDKNRVRVNVSDKANIENWKDVGVKYGTATLREKNGKYYLDIPIYIDIEQHTPCTVVGIDVGMRFLATTYDSSGHSKFFKGGEVKNKRAHYKALRSQLQRKQTPSARKRLKSIGKRENGWMTDINHQVSRALVDSYSKPTLFVLEDLTGIKDSSVKVRKNNRYYHVSWAYYQLRQFIEYKAKLAGHTTIAVDPHYTSQMCPKCMVVDKRSRNKKMHEFRCTNCGYRSNDDRVAAMNLHLLGRLHLLTGMLGQDLSIQGLVNSPYVSTIQGGSKS